MSKKHLDFKRMLDDTDFSDPSSIERYAANLDGMTFRDILELGIAPEGESAPKDFGSKKYKGGMGTLIEERYFGYKANSDDRPDFPEAGVELNPYRDASGKLKVTNNLPGMADNPIVHVRPHTSKAAYKFADGTEIGDIARNAYKLPDGRWMTKQSFWFNKGYLEHILGL